MHKHVAVVMEASSSIKGFLEGTSSSGISIVDLDSLVFLDRREPFVPLDEFFLNILPGFSKFSGFFQTIRILAKQQEEANFEDLIQDLLGFHSFVKNQKKKGVDESHLRAQLGPDQIASFIRALSQILPEGFPLPELSKPDEKIYYLALYAKDISEPPFQYSDVFSADKQEQKGNLENMVLASLSSLGRQGALHFVITDINKITDEFYSYSRAYLKQYEGTHNQAVAQIAVETIKRKMVGNIVWEAASVSGVHTKKVPLAYL